MKYFDDPVYESKFNQFIDLFATLIEKYGGEIVFPTEENSAPENKRSAVQCENPTTSYTDQHVA